MLGQFYFHEGNSYTHCCQDNTYCIHQRDYAERDQPLEDRQATRRKRRWWQRLWGEEPQQARS